MGSIPLHLPSSITPPSTSTAMPGDSNNEEVVEPPRKRFKLFAALPKPSITGELASEIETRKKLKTAKCTNWSVNVFHNWIVKRNKETETPENLIPSDLLEQKYEQEASSVEPLVQWLSLFVVEACGRDGKPYTPLSLQGLLFGLLRYMRQQDPNAPNFMDKKDRRFRELHSVIEKTFAHLEEEGVNILKKYTPLVTDVTPDQENHLWKLGVLGTDSPLKLIRTVYFKMSSVFHINGALKHRHLKPSILRRDVNPDRYTYVVAEGRSKTNPVGCKSNKFLKFYPIYYASSSKGERCLVYLLDLYLAKLPSYAFEKDVFYLRPKIATPKLKDCPWYEPIPVGIEKLRTMSRDICAAAGLHTTLVPSVLPSTDRGQASQVNEMLLVTEEVSQLTVPGTEELCTHDHQKELHEWSPPEQSQEEEEEAMVISPMTSTQSCTGSDIPLHAELHPLPSGKLKKESEIHIYESDHHTVYIYMHRCKGVRRGSCPPTFTSDCHNH